MELPTGKKIYFLSDFHLGAPDAAQSRIREKIIVEFLNSIKEDAFAIFIVGDVFDFWYEYKKVVPKGYVRLLGKLAELTDVGIAIYLFVGNHDMWMKTYFQQELNIPVYFKPQEFSFNGKLFYIAHGDGLGPGDHGYKRLKSIFRNPFCQWMFGMLPPQAGMGIANYFSRKSREKTGQTEEFFLGEDKEWLILHSKNVLDQKKVDFFIYGHRHLPIDFRLDKGSRYINLGDWINFDTYAEFDGEMLELKSYSAKENKIVRNY